MAKQGLVVQIFLARGVRVWCNIWSLLAVLFRMYVSTLAILISGRLYIFAAYPAALPWVAHTIFHLSTINHPSITTISAHINYNFYKTL
jgi:hypothetical protein